MKRLLTVLAILLVAASLFAAGTVKVGAAFEPIIGGTKEYKLGERTLPKDIYKTHGLGFDISGRYVVKGDFSVWADFSMVFCSDLKSKDSSSSDWVSYNDMYKVYEAQAKEENGKASKAINSLSLAAGSAVKLTLNAPFDINVGAGIFFERVFAKVSLTLPKSSPTAGEYANGLKAFNIGVVGYADAAFKITEKIGISLSIMPRIGLYDKATCTLINKSETTEYKGSGFALSFSMPVVVGASYSF